MLRCMFCMEGLRNGEAACPNCGHDNTNVPPQDRNLPAGYLLADRYLLGRVLGSGGFGITYIAYDQQLERKVAVKEFFPSDFATRQPGSSRLSVFTGDAATFFLRAKDGFIREGRSLAAFANKTGIVTIYDSLEANDTAYIVMEYLEGQTLKELMQTRGRLDFPDALTLIVPVLEALETVHGADIIHRDVSPDNIFVRRDGTVALIDFGAARTYTPDAAKSMTVVLKPGYAPVEQYHSKGNQGPWTDVYAAAATIYRVITGVVPDESVQRSFGDTLKRPSDLGIEILEVSENALMSALVIQPHDRIKSAAELLSGLLGETIYADPATAVSQQASASSVAQDKGSNTQTNPNTYVSYSAAGVEETPLPHGGDDKPVHRRKGGRVPLIIGINVMAVIAVVVLVFLVSTENPASAENNRIGTVASSENEGEENVVSTETATRQNADVQMEVDDESPDDPTGGGAPEDVTGQTEPESNTGSDSMNTDAPKNSDPNSSTVKTGDIMRLGNISFDTNGYDSTISIGEMKNGGDFTWRVLEVIDSRALVISVDVIAFEPYNGNYTNTTWDKSTIRTWLNNDFLKSLPSDVQSRIVSVDITNNKNPDYGTSGGEGTKDKVFLLSIDEAKRYFPSNKDCAAPLNIAGSQYNGTAAYWWLRSPGEDNERTAIVKGNEGIDTKGQYSGSGYSGIRPAFWIKL